MKTSVILAMISIVGAITHAATYVDEYGTWEYSSSGDNYQITKWTQLENGPTDIVIPDTINGKNVTAIGYKTFSGSVITSVVLPSKLTYLGDCAFHECQALTNMTPTVFENVTFVNTTFYNTKNLKIPIKIKGACTMGVNIFQSSGITALDLSEYTGSTIGGTFCNGCSSLGDLKLPDSGTLTTIGGNAFCGCSSLTNVTPFLPSSVTSLGQSAFNGCSSLTNPCRLDAAVSQSLSFINCGTSGFDFSRNTNITTFAGIGTFGQAKAWKWIKLPKNFSSLGTALSWGGFGTNLDLYFRSSLPPETPYSCLKSYMGNLSYRFFVPERKINAWSNAVGSAWAQITDAELNTYNARNTDDAGEAIATWNIALSATSSIKVFVVPWNPPRLAPDKGTVLLLK